MTTTTPPSPFMIMTTTPSVEGRKIVEYCGVIGVDSCATGSLGANEKEGLIMSAAATRQSAIEDVKASALNVGADAIVELCIDYTYMGVSEAGLPVLIVAVSGTAVKLA